MNNASCMTEIIAFSIIICLAIAPLAIKELSNKKS